MVMHFGCFQTYSETVGHNFALNATFDEVDASSYDGLWVPGGRAPEYLAHIPGVVELVTKFVSLGKQIASICHGQLILAAAGVVEGRKCTLFLLLNQCWLLLVLIGLNLTLRQQQ